jgi:hypothetical protein
MKSYTVHGLSSIEKGVEYGLQGHTQYKPNESSIETRIFHINYDDEVRATIAALVMFSLSSYFLGLYLITKYYDKVCKMHKQYN